MMQQSHPVLGKEHLQSTIDEENMKKERIGKSELRVSYLQLHNAIEALVHICRDGCQTIGPNGRDLEANEEPCRHEACNALKMLIRDCAACKLRVPGGYIPCKRMCSFWSCILDFATILTTVRFLYAVTSKDRIQKQSKKAEFTWRTLVKNIERQRDRDSSILFIRVMPVTHAVVELPLSSDV